jgi:hypothetical protein
MASGHGGQFVYVNPPTETVIVRLGHGQGDLMQTEWVQLFQELSVLP